MQITKIGQCNSINQSKISNHKATQSETQPNSPEKEVSFSGLGIHNFIKTVFKKEVASTGKYPLSAKDAILRLKPGMTHSKTEASRNCVWINEYLPNSRNAIRETLFSDKGAKLEQIHSCHPATGASKKSLYFKEDGKSLDHIELYNQEGRKTKSIYFDQKENKIETVTNYDTKTGDELNWVHYKGDGKTVDFIRKPKICGGDTTF